MGIPATAAIITLASVKRIDPGENYMLSAIAVILFVLWALGMVSSYSVGGLVNLLLFLALVVTVIDLLRERRSLT